MTKTVRVLEKGWQEVNVYSTVIMVHRPLVAHQIPSCHDLVVGADDPFSDEVETKHLRSQEVAAEDVVLKATIRPIRSTDSGNNFLV